MSLKGNGYNQLVDWIRHLCMRKPLSDIFTAFFLLLLVGCTSQSALLAERAPPSYGDSPWQPQSPSTCDRSRHPHFWPWYGYWYCDRACRSPTLFFCQNFLLQHAFNQAGLSSSRDIAGGSLVKLIWLGHPLKNQVSANIHGIDRISLKGKGNPID